MNDTLSIHITGAVASGKTRAANAIYRLFTEFPIDDRVTILKDENTYRLNGASYLSADLNKELQRLGTPKILLISTGNPPVA